MAFNPDEYLAKNTSQASSFDPDAYLAKNQALVSNRDALEPGVMGDTVPVEQKFLNNSIDALTGATLPSAVAGLTKGVTGTMGQYAKRFGQNQAMKSLGASGGQIGQVGIPESREIAQSMIDQGVVSPMRGPIGAEELVNKLSTETGGRIGAHRNLGDTRGDSPQMAEILDRVNKTLTNKYASGVNRAPGVLRNAKEEIAKGGTGTFAGNAQKATDLNASISGNKMFRPQGATSDAADTITHMNNEKLKALSTPEEWAQHEKDLANYGPLQKVKSFMERGERKEMGGHQGGSLTKAAADKTMDAFGNRTASALGSGLGDILQSASKTPFSPQALAAYLIEKYNRGSNAQ